MNEPTCIEVASVCVGRDDPGCYWGPSVWTRPLAISLTLRDYIGPGPDNWRRIKFNREWCEKGGSVPGARRLLKTMGERSGPAKGARRLLNHLIPCGSGLGTGRIVGMTMPRKVMLDV